MSPRAAANENFSSRDCVVFSDSEHDSAEVESICLGRVANCHCLACHSVIYFFVGPITGAMPFAKCYSDMLVDVALLSIAFRTHRESVSWLSIVSIAC